MVYNFSSGNYYTKLRIFIASRVHSNKSILSCAFMFIWLDFGLGGKERKKESGHIIIIIGAFNQFHLCFASFQCT